MIFLIYFLVGVFCFNAFATAASDSQSTFQNRFREKVKSAGIFGKKLPNQEFRPKTAEFSRTSTPGSNKRLSPIGLESQASTEYSSNSTPASSPKNSISSTNTSSSKDSASSYITRVPRNLGNLKRPSSTRRLAISANPILTSNDQYSTAQAYSYLSKIQDTQIRREAENFVGAAKTSEDKKELAFAWLEYLSKIESVVDRHEAANQVRRASAEDKQCQARLWLEFFTRIPAGSMRNKAIADVNDEQTHESKELIAKIWAEYLSQITDEKVQNRAASAVRRVSFYSKEPLAKEWLRLSKTNALDFVERTSSPAQKTTSWWKILSEIKNVEIKNEARGYIENEITDRDDKMTMARIWVEYLSKILDESQRCAAIKAVMQASVNQWEDIASHYHAQYKGWA